MCVFLGRAMNFFWPQSRGDRPPRGSAAAATPYDKTCCRLVEWTHSAAGLPRLSWKMADKRRRASEAKTFQKPVSAVFILILLHMCGPHNCCKPRCTTLTYKLISDHSYTENVPNPKCTKFDDPV